MTTEELEADARALRRAALAKYDAALTSWRAGDMERARALREEALAEHQEARVLLDEAYARRRLAP